MELIEVSFALGLAINKVLKPKGFIPRENSLGLVAPLYTQEELDQITELEFINEPGGYLKGIEHLRNLKSLSITTYGETAFRNYSVSITDDDTNHLAKATSIRTLVINNQSKMTGLYLDDLVNLQELSVTKNSALDEITGLDKLKRLKDFSVFGNKNLYDLPGIVDLINDNTLECLELDLLNYPEVEMLKGKLYKMLNCYFIETLTGQNVIPYTAGQVYLFHERCLDIVSKIKKLSKDRMMQIIGIEKYIASTIAYDSDGLDNQRRAHTEGGKQMGKSGGTNSAVNGIMYGTCVCEGYTRVMQYLLKLLGIKTENVYCISGADQIKIDNNYHNVVTLPDDGFHSIIRIDDEHMLYCDPCWDACTWQSGDTTLPYCLLTKKEMSVDHTFSFEEEIIDNDYSTFPRDRLALYLKGLSIAEAKVSMQDNEDQIKR